MSEESLAGLRDVRLPPVGTLDVLADMFAAVGLGLAAAGCLALLMSAVFRTRATRRPSVEARIAHVRTLPEDQRVPALLLELRSLDKAAADRFRATAYTKGGLPDTADLEALMRKAS